MADTPRRNYDPWGMLKIGLLLLFNLAMLGMLTYYVMGIYYGTHWSMLDCLFMVVITLTTVGYDDWLHIRPYTGATIFTMFLALAGIGVPAFVISTVTALAVEGVVGDTFRRRRMQQEIAALNGHVVVCGAGGTGEHCIMELLRINSKIVVIDKNRERLEELQHLGSFPFVVGRSDNDDVLLAAGVQRAAGLLACLPEDRDNLFITLSARVLNPDIRIASKGVDDHVRKKMVIAGANSVVSPTAIGGLRLVSELMRPATTSFLDGMLRDRTAVRFGELNVAKESRLAGSTLAAADLRSLADVLVVAARHPGVESFIYNPKADFRLDPGGVIVVLGLVNEIEKLRPLFESTK